MKEPLLTVSKKDNGDFDVAWTAERKLRGSIFHAVVHALLQEMIREVATKIPFDQLIQELREIETTLVRSLAAGVQKTTVLTDDFVKALARKE